MTILAQILNWSGVESFTVSNVEIKPINHFFKVSVTLALLVPPESSECILKPELCQAHEGISRDMEWSEKYCLSNHYVYIYH